MCEGDNKGNDWYKNSRYTAGTSLNKDGEDLLKDYTIVVLGFADAFDNITNTHALANLRDYIESGKAVLMTHDTIGQYSYTDENTDETESLFEGDDSDIRRAVPIMIDDKISKGYMFTTAFRNIVGMDMYHVTVGQAKENLSYQQGYTNTIVTRYGVLPGYDYKMIIIIYTNIIIERKERFHRFVPMLLIRLMMDRLPLIHIRYQII